MFFEIVVHFYVKLSGVLKTKNPTLFSYLRQSNRNQIHVKNPLVSFFLVVWIGSLSSEQRL